MRLDRHRIGLETSAELQAVGDAGTATPRLWALGPIVRGMFWECTAVPDIRNQAVALARSVAAAQGPSAVFDHPTPERLAAYLHSELTGRGAAAPSPSARSASTSIPVTSGSASQSSAWS